MEVIKELLKNIDDTINRLDEMKNDLKNSKFDHLHLDAELIEAKAKDILLLNIRLKDEYL